MPGAELHPVLAPARGQLAAFKMPAVAAAVPQIPRTAAGKLDLTRARALAAAAQSTREQL